MKPMETHRIHEMFGFKKISMPIRSLPNPFSFDNILHACEKAPAILSIWIVGNMVLCGMGPKVVFNCSTGFASNFNGAVLLDMSFEEWVFCDIYNGRINMVFGQICGSTCFSRFGIM